VFLQFAIYVDSELFCDILLETYDVYCMSQNMWGNLQTKKFEMKAIL
jgi:hypothetical protein